MNSTNSIIEQGSGGVPSIIILNRWSRSYVNDAALQIAPWFIGTCCELLLQGILVVQTSNYFNYRDPTGRSLPFVWLVLVLNLLCVLKSAQNIKIVWDVMITTYANPDVSARILGSSWTAYSTALSTAIIAVFVQTFFVHRYYLLTKRWYVCVFIAMGIMLSLVACIIAVYYIPKIRHRIIRMWSLVHFVSAIVVDALITSFTAWFLYKQKSAITSTSNLIDRLLRMVWQTALPPTLCVIVDAVVLETRPVEITHLIFNTILPKLYAISLLYTLNSRNEIRSNQEGTDSTGYQITGFQIAPAARPRTTFSMLESGNTTGDIGAAGDDSSRAGAETRAGTDDERRVSVRFEINREETQNSEMDPDALQSTKPPALADLGSKTILHRK